MNNSKAIDVGIFSFLRSTQKLEHIGIIRKLGVNNIIITMVMLLCMAAIYIKNVIIPEASLEMADFNPNLTSTMYYKDPDTGNYEVMQTLYGSENRVWVDLSEIPKNLQNAAVAIEDKRFYDHNGVVPQKLSC